MRNGNLNEREGIVWINWVLTVPMRNGNTLILGLDELLPPTFLPYL